MKIKLNTIAFTTVALALAFTTNLTSAQAAHAEQAQGQMIDDSGLVISSNADGSLREFKLSEQELATLKIFSQTTVVLNQNDGQVLNTVIASNTAH